MTRRAALVASLIAVLDQPRWWVIAQAVFLLRGGIVLAIIPIVVLPTEAGLFNALGPLLVGFYFGAPSAAFVRLVTVISGLLLAWLLAGGLLASRLEVTLIDDVARRAGRAGTVARPGALAWRALLIRITCMTPLLAALGWGATQVVAAAYAEVLHPTDLTTPIALRVAMRVPDVIVLIGVVWLAGETAAGTAVRRLALGLSPSTATAFVHGWLDAVARPWSLLLAVVTNAAVLAIVAGGAAAAAYAWFRLRVAIGLQLGLPWDPLIEAASSMAFVAIWLAGLALASVVVSWRSSAWTFEAVRRDVGPLDRRHAGEGTLVNGARAVPAAD
jgi:hypothetical protein